MFDTVTQKSLFFYLAPALKVEFAANKTFDGLLQFLGDLSPADQFLNIAAFDESYQRNFLGRLSPQQLFSTLTLLDLRSTLRPQTVKNMVTEPANT